MSGEALPGNLSYISECADLQAKKCSATQPSDFLQSSLQLEAYRCRAAHLLSSTSVTLQNGGFLLLWSGAHLWFLLLLPVCQLCVLLLLLLLLLLLAVCMMCGMCMVPLCLRLLGN
jgi:hypothetical protein